jgi:hypothetical protein
MTQNNYQALSPVSNKGGLLKSNDSSVMEGDRTTLGDVKNNYIELGTKAKAKIDNLFGGGD